MTAMRAMLVLISLAALLPAAPAPLPREKRHAEPGGWSQTVDGLRVRLLAPQNRYRVGETVRLVMEIQNASDRPRSLEEPDLSYAVSDPRSAPVGWSITSERRAEKDELRRDQRRVLWEARKQLRSGMTRLGA